jgi:hypothetical protein
VLKLDSHRKNFSSSKTAILYRISIRTTQLAQAKVYLCQPAGVSFNWKHPNAKQLLSISVRGEQEVVSLSLLINKFGGVPIVLESPFICFCRCGATGCGM